jgi:hypothetical protein
LTAEEQAEVQLYVMEKRRKEAQRDEPLLQSVEAEGGLCVGDAASSESGGTSDDAGSDWQSVVSAAVSVAESSASSRSERKKQRTEQFLKAKE